MADSSMNVVCDASAFVLLVKLVEFRLNASQRTLSLCDLGFELCRIESEASTADAGKLVVRLYPSDAFLRFVAAHFARDVDLAIVE